MRELIIQPDDKFRLGDFLLESLTNPDWNEFRAAIAFVKRSGTKHIQGALADFSRRASVGVSVGINSGGTSAEGLEDLIEAVLPKGKLWVFHNTNSSTFHPKVYLFRNAKAADLIVGSGNLTEGGLFTNYEMGIRLGLDLSDSIHRALLKSVEAALHRWSTHVPGLCFPLDSGFLGKLIDAGKVPSEAFAKESEEGPVSGGGMVATPASDLFKGKRVQPAPKVAGYFAKSRPQRRGVSPAPVEIKPDVSTSTIASEISAQTFVMTLQTTDVGFGQTSIGAAKRSPEIFIPIGAVDANPSFWGWPELFVTDEAWAIAHAKKIAAMARSRRSDRSLEKMDRENVKFRMTKTGNTVSATVWYNPDKIDLRIRNRVLRASGKVGDILVLRKATADSKHHYDFEVVPQGNQRFAKLDAACRVRAAANSKKRFGYI